MGKKLETLWLSHASQNRETRYNANSFLESPSKFSGMFTYPRQPDEESKEAGPTDLENQMEQAKIACCHLINKKIAIDSLFLKENVKMKVRNFKRTKKWRMYYTTKLSPSVFLPVSLR